MLEKTYSCFHARNVLTDAGILRSSGKKEEQYSAVQVGHGWVLTNSAYSISNSG